MPILYFFFSLNDPFHGDGISTVARAALFIYDSGLRSIFYPIETDPGHPTFIPYLLAVLWTLTGTPTLWMAHLLSTVFSIGVLFRAKQLIGAEHHPNIGLILIAISPLFVAQTTMILTHIPLTFFFLSTFYFFLEKKYFYAGLWAVPMLLTHLEGLFLLFGIGCIFLADFFTSRPLSLKKTFEVLPVFIPAVVAFGIWVYFHEQHTGWYVSAPEYAAHRSFATLFGFLYNIALIIWRIGDYAYFLFYIGLAWWVARHKKLPPSLRHLILLTVVLSILVALFLSGSIAHRYFLPIQILAVITFWQVLQPYLLQSKPLKIGGIALLLVGGNFFYYRFKCIGDANIVYRNYFSIEKEIKTEYPNIVWGTYAPLSNPSRSRYLDDHSGLKTYRLYEARFDTCQYILQSNLTCEFTSVQKDSLEKYWVKMKTFHRGGIWVKLYQRPN